MAARASGTKVLMICQDVRVDRRIILQAQTLQAAGYRVAVLTRAEPEGDIPENEADGGIRVLRVRVEGNDPRFRWLTRLAGIAGQRGHAATVNAAKLWGAITAKSTFSMLAYGPALRARADVYHAHDLNNLPLAYRLAATTGARLAYDAHELFSEMNNPWVRVRRGHWRRTEKRLLTKCDLATTVNEFIADEMAKRYDVNPPAVLYNCPPKPTDFDPAQTHFELYRALSIAPETRIVLYQGWMAEGRGLEQLVLGARYLRGKNAVLALMGYGEHRPQLEDIVSEHGSGDVVHFLDAVPQSDLLAYCASATVGVIPYRPVDLNNYYSSPNKLFDFIQAQVPVLANDLPFLTKVVRGRDIGLTVPMTTSDSVGQAMLDILNALDSPGTRARWSQNLRDASEIYNWEHEGDKLLKLYSEKIDQLYGAEG